MRCIYLAGAMIAALPLWTALAAGPTSQGIQVNFTILPGSQVQGQPVKRYFGLAVAPGQTYSDSVLIVNPSKTHALTVKLSVSDAATPPQGGGLAFNDTHQQHYIGSWLRLSQSSVVVPPNMIAHIPLSLVLPASVQPGEYLGAINAIDTSPVTVTSGKLKFSVYVNRRCLVRLQVPGVAPIGLAVARVGMTGPPAARLVSITLKNTGTVVDYPGIAVLTFTGASKAYTVRVRVGQLLGGDSTSLAFAAKRIVPPGAYQVGVRVAYAVYPAPGAAAQSFQATWSGPVVVD